MVLKSRGILNLKMAFRHGDVESAVAQYVGEVAAGDLNMRPIWDQNVMVCGTQTMSVACYSCGTMGHWLDNCPHPEEAPGGM